MTLGDLLAFFTLIWFIITPLWSLGVHINSYTQSKASGERILQVFNQFIHVKDKQGAKNLQSESVNGHVIFQDVTFAYPENPHALIHFSVDAPPGKIIGLLGPTGSGKSTVIQLLFRAYNVKEGRILLDGHDIQDVTVESLRRQIAVVFQETFLFSSTIRNNIAYGIRDVSLEQVMTAAKLARAHEFIMELPDGYDTIVGERGLGLSGGQKQRIAIARALIADPKVLILDDSTSAVDMETEHEIQLGLREVMKGRTTIIIAHRISSLKHANEIIVLDRGHTIQRGTHEELIEQAGRYRETYAIQYADHPNFNQGKQ
jgi:ATP-binding cassette subfamily B protein